MICENCVKFETCSRSKFFRSCLNKRKRGHCSDFDMRDKRPPFLDFSEKREKDRQEGIIDGQVTHTIGLKWEEMGPMARLVGVDHRCSEERIREIITSPHLEIEDENKDLNGEQQMNGILKINGKKYKVEVTPEVLKQLEPKKPKGKYIPCANETFWVVYKDENEEYATQKYVLKAVMSFFIIIQNTYVFPTEEATQEYIRYLTALDKYGFVPDWEDANQDKWLIYHNWNNRSLEINCRCVLQNTKTAWFPSEFAARNFISEVGESTVKKFMFDIWDE